MSVIKERERNCSIDIFRYICAVMVVAIHTCPFMDINENLGYVFTGVIPRVAVPFFFAVAGYFYIRKLEKGQKPFFTYIKRILITYTIWSVIYFAVEFVKQDFSSLIYFAYFCAYHFVLTGSYYHFWYFPALIFAICITTLLYKIKCKKLLVPIAVILYIIGCIGSPYHGLGIKIPVLRELFLSNSFELVRRIFLSGLPFFISGYIIYKLSIRAKGKLTNKKLLIIFAAIITADITELCVVKTFKLDDNITVSFFLYPLIITMLLILLKNPLPKRRIISNKCLVLANFTYYSHPLFIVGFTALGKNLLSAGLSETPMFIAVAAVTFIVGFVIYKIDNKYLNFIVK